MAQDDATSPSARSHAALRPNARAARLSVAVAAILIMMKFWAWRASSSVAMLSSLADSALDLAASIFTLGAVLYAARPPDAAHRFGHGKAEGLVALAQAGLVGFAAAVVAHAAWSRFAAPTPVAAGGPAIAVMLASIALTGGLILAQSRALAAQGSIAIEGDRAHYAADLAANGVVIVGIAGSAFFGVRWIDPVAGVLVAAWLVGAAFKVAGGALDELLDRELDDAARAKIRRLALDGGEFLGIHMLRTRASGPDLHIQFHADLPAHLSLANAHARIVAVEKRLTDAFPNADVLIHPDPKGVAEPHGREETAAHL